MWPGTLIHRDDRGQSVHLSMIDELEELLIDLRRATLGPKVIQDQHLRITHLLLRLIDARTLESVGIDGVAM